MTPLSMSSSTAPAPRLRCRVLRPDDAPRAAGLLASGFPERSTAFWDTALRRLAAHAQAIAAFGIGFGLEADDELVGVLLVIEKADTGVDALWNLSSWYVRPRYSAYGPMLASQPLRRKSTTLYNISPAPHTWPIIEAQGFRRCSQGRMLAVPALMPGHRHVRVAVFDPHGAREAALPAGEREMLQRHAAYGCLALCVTDETGAVVPYLFLPRRIKKLLPGAQLVYCREMAAFSRHAGALGRALLRRGMAAVLVDLNGPPPALPGWRLADRSPRYVRGPSVPPTGDLTDTELVMFGL